MGLQISNVVSAPESRQADRWKDRGLVITDADGCSEPTAIYLDGTFHVWFTSAHRIYHATSVDGLTFAVDADPVVGGGASGESANAARAHVVQIDGALYLSYSDVANDPNGNIYMLRSVDGGATWTDRTLILTRSAANRWGNRRIVVEGSTLYMLAERERESVGQSIALYTATDPMGPWTEVESMIMSVNIPVFGGTSVASPGQCIKVNDRYCMWYWCQHGYGDFNGTELYFSSSLDLLNWSYPRRLWRAKDTTLNGHAVLQHADVTVVEARGRSYLYYSVVTSADQAIAARVYDGPLSAVVAEARDEEAFLPKVATRPLVPDYINGENYAVLLRRYEWAAGVAPLIRDVEGLFSLPDHQARSLKLAPTPSENQTWVIRSEGGVTCCMGQQYLASGVAVSYYGNSVIKTCGSGAASGKLRYLFSANFAASAGDVIVMSPSGHTFVVDDGVTDATAWTSANVGGVTVREITGGSAPSASDTSLTVNGGAPVATTFVKNSATNADDFAAIIFFASSSGVHVYSPVFGGRNTHYQVSGL